MPRFLILPILSLLAGKVYSQEPGISQPGDTVIFDLSVSVINGISTDFPVYLSSSDSIYSLDFAVRYDPILVEFDSLAVLPANMQFLYHYNYADSTFRFTSNSIVPIPPGIPVLHMIFNVVNAPLCINDIELTEVWLNGNLCTGHVKNCVLSSISENEIFDEYRAYPNPVHDLLILSYPGKYAWAMYESTGRFVNSGNKISFFENVVIDVKSYPPGVYFLNFISEIRQWSIRIIVAH